jgi:tetratricopeptide (TPR) repeat protein
VLHLGALLDAGAAPPDAHARRARAHAELRRWAEALADYDKALEGGESEDLRAGRGDAAAALGRWDQAVADYSKALDRDKERAELWLKRGQAEAGRRQWAKAAADLGKGIGLGRNRLGADEPALWHQQAVALLAAGDKAGYRKLAGQMQKRFPRSSDRAAARWVARTCALADGPNLKALVAQAEKAVKSAPEPAELRRLAVLLYRSGEHEQAVKRMQELGRLPDQELGPRDALLLALAHHKLGRADEARTWLSKALAGLPKSAPWHEREENELWRREAEGLINPPKS